MKTTDNFIILAVAAVALLSAGCRKQTDYSAYRRPIPVEVVVTDTQTVVSSRSYVGTVEEATMLRLVFPLGGKVTGVYVSKNAQVRAGQVLASVEDTQQRSILQSAEATLQQAEDGYRRLKQVYEQGAVAEVKWIEMQTQLEKARAAVGSARKNVDDCTLRAPQSGVVSECELRVGQQLAPGQRAVTLIDATGVNIRFAVPENEIAAVGIGSESRVTVAALGNRLYEGRVTERDMNANRLSHSYEVKVALSNADGQLLPGMVCKVQLRKDDISGFIVPAECIQVRQVENRNPEISESRNTEKSESRNTGMPKNRKTLWVVDSEKKARLREVEISHYAVDGVIVTGGLQCGEQVVVKGWQKLYEGAEVIEN